MTNLRKEDGATDPKSSGPASNSPKPDDNGRVPPAGGLPGTAVDLTTAKASSAPGMPHEQDEAVGMTDQVPSKRVEQAYDDVTKGREDTSRGLESDQAYQRQKEGS